MNKSNPKTWSQHCKEYSQTNGCSYKEAMSLSKDSWQKYKQQQGMKGGGCANHKKCMVKPGTIKRQPVRLEPIVQKDTPKEAKQKTKAIKKAKEEGSYLPLKEFAFLDDDGGDNEEVVPQPKKKRQSQKKSSSKLNMEDTTHSGNKLIYV